MNKQAIVCPQLLSYGNELSVNPMVSANGPEVCSVPRGDCLAIRKIKDREQAGK